MEFLKASDAAERLGVSVKALKLYEESGLVAPSRTAAGWRAYGPDEMRRASDVAALRALGFSLSEVVQVLNRGSDRLEPALAAHQTVLEARVRALMAARDKVRALRHELAPAGGPRIAFDLPWPWGGERFELHDIKPLTHITGPLGSGKTRLAMRLAETLPGAVFLGLDRDADLDALLEAEGPSAFVVDMIEQGLDEDSQRLLIARLRARGPGVRPIFLLTRSSAILDLELVGCDEAILYCPANHGMPMRVAPHPGALGYDAVASCLATPQVRARTQGVIAWRAAESAI